MEWKPARILLFVILVCLGMFLAGGQVDSVDALPAMQSNIVQNPSLEEPYSGGAARGWARWHQESNANPKPANCSEYYLVQPTWSPEFNGSIILDGARSQHIGNQFDTWRAGVMQTVSVTPGSTYRFSFWGTGRASNDQYPAPSDSVNMGVRAGIDPNGSGLWSDSDIVWGAAGSPIMGGGQGNWQQFSVEATATGNQVTVFIQADFGGANQCRAHLDIWFDKAELVEAGPPPPPTSPPQPTLPPAPAATNTPIPATATLTPEVSPTDSPQPTDVPTNTPVPPQGGVICVNAFADDNANGQREADEGYMAGVTFTIAQADSVVAQGVSTGTSTPICFENIPAGSYLVAQIVPRNLEMTTAASTTVDVTTGSTISLEFGSRVRTDIDGEEIADAATATAVAQSPPDQGSDNSGDNGGISLLAIVGLGAILLAVLMLGVLIFILLRQQRA